MLAFLVLPFLFAGVIAFLVCAVVPPLRRFALSSALWFVALLPGLVIGLIIRGTWAVATDQLFFSHQSWQQNILHLSQTRSASVISAIALALIMIALASAIAVVHQVTVHRLTFALFRLYVAGVGSGIGLLLSLLLVVGLAVANIHVSHSGQFFLILALLSAFVTAILCFRNASSLRGKYPRNFPIVTEEEFESTR